MRVLEGFNGLDPRANALRQRGAGRLADPVDGEDGCAIEPRREIRRCGVGQMVGHEMESLAERASKKFFDRTLHLTEPQAEGFLDPRIPPFGAISLPAQLGIKRIGDMIDIAAGEAGVFQAKADRALGELVRVIPSGFLGMLDPIEALLLDGGDEPAIDEQRRGGLVKYTIDSEDVNHPAPLLSLFFQARRISNFDGKKSWHPEN